MASTLKPVYNRQFTGANSLEVSLVKDTDPQRSVFKSGYFCFITVTPGMIDQNSGNRTFNRQGRITMKAECEQILAISHGIRAWCHGAGLTHGKLRLFADPSKSNYNQGQSGGKKQVYLSSFKKGENTQYEETHVSINFNQGQGSPISYSTGIPDALAIADVLEILAKKGLELDFNDKTFQLGQTNYTAPDSDVRMTEYQQPIDQINDAMTHVTNHNKQVVPPPPPQGSQFKTPGGLPF